MAVIVSMTSIPARNGTLGKTIASLKAQTVAPDAIHLFAPPHVEDPGGVCMVRMATDIGPLMKLTAVTTYGLAPDDIVVTVDDDQVYQPTWLETLLAGAREFPNAAVGFAGWYAEPLLRMRKFHFTKEPCTCDVLEGWAGVAYRVKFFREMESVDIHGGSAKIKSPTHVLSAPEIFRMCDDVWISGYLMARGIERRVIRTPMAKDVDQKPGLHHHPHFKAANVVATEWWWGRS